MNKRWVVIILLGAIGFAILFAWYKSDSAEQPSKTSGPSETLQTTNSTAQSGVYVDYSPSVLAETSGDKVLFFHAPWCPQCRSIEQGINAQGIPEGLTIIKVDYDTNQALRQKYGVTLQTTFVKVDAVGNGISKYVAYDEPTFEAVKHNFLNL